MKAAPLTMLEIADAISSILGALEDGERQWAADELWDLGKRVRGAAGAEREAAQRVKRKASRQRRPGAWT